MRQTSGTASPIVARRAGKDERVIKTLSPESGLSVATGWQCQSSRFSRPAVPRLFPAVFVKEIEEAGPDERHHAHVRSVDFPVIDVEPAFLQILLQGAAGLERARRLRAFSHQDRQSAQPLERIGLL